MSGIFVDENDKFEVVVYYMEEKNRVKILEEKTDGCKSFSMTFRYPDFSASQEIIKSSMLDSDGGPTINMFRLRANTLYYLADSWNIKDKDGKDVEFSIEKLNKIQPSIVAHVINKVQLEIGESGILT